MNPDEPSSATDRNKISAYIVSSQQVEVSLLETSGARQSGLCSGGLQVNPDPALIRPAATDRIKIPDYTVSPR
jgi:hypothetical protein